MTGLRFFLAIWVLLHHITGRGMMLESAANLLPGPLHTFIRAGYLAVGTFFVLSGFVLARRYSTTQWTGQSLYRYTVTRFARVYPVYALSLLVILPFMLMEFRPAWIANYVVLLQGWWGDKVPVFWNTPAWSLSCEIFFYATFPLVVLVARFRNWFAVLALAGFACVLTATLRRNGMSEDLKPFLHFSDFLIGIATAGVYDLLLARRWRPGGAWLYLPATVAFIVLVCLPSLVPQWSTLNGLLRPLNAIALLGFAFGGGLVARLLSTEPAVFLGKASYSLYILHVPLLWWWKFMQPINPLPGPISAAVYTVLVIWVTAWVYRRFEEPANRRVKAYLLKKPPSTAIDCPVM